MPIETLTEIPDSFGSGHSGLAPGGSQGSPNLRDLLREHSTALEQLDDDLAGGLQAGNGTLVAGTFTVSTGVTIAASSEILLTFRGRPGTTTNLATLAVVSRTNGAPGVGAFTVEAVLATGAIDSDAVGSVSWLIVG